MEVHDDDDAHELVLPEDLMTKILLTSPVKCNIRCKCVCKSWCSLIKSQSFIEQHLNNSSNNRCVLVNGSMETPEMSNHKTINYPAITRIFSYETLQPVTARSFSSAFPLREEDNLDQYFTSFWIKGCCNGLLRIVDRDRDMNYATALTSIQE